MRPNTETLVRDYWDRSAGNFDAIYTGRKVWLSRTLDRWLRRDMYDRFEWTLQMSGNLHGKSVCDVGCGSGRYAVALAKKGASEVTGVDVAPEMLKLAHNLAASEGVAQRCQFEEADVLSWNCSRQFDLTLAVGLWDYVDDPSDRLQVIRRITGEKFLASWPRAGTFRTQIRKARLTASGCPVYFYQEADIRRFLEDAQFRVEQCSIVGQLYLTSAIAV